MTVSILFALPWTLLPLLALLIMRRRPTLERWPPLAAGGAPLVSAIVPARNEEQNVGACLDGLLASDYPRLEVLVVDDGSSDRTAEVVRARAGPGLRLMRAGALPPGWFGKPWACWRGAAEATGELLLFTDADVIYHPEAISRAVSLLKDRRADLVTLIPRQLLASFWERLVMPQITTMMQLRYPDPERVNRSRRARDKLGVGGFLLLRREAYQGIGGHLSVRFEVAEDLRLAQGLHAAGRRVVLAVGDRFVSVRMYRSLREIFEGWTKNVAIASRQVVPAALRAATPWLLVGWLLLAWLFPPLVLLLVAAGALGAGWGVWGGVAAGAGVLFWAVVYRRLGLPLWYSLLFPFGAAVAAAILLCSALRGGRVRWKGREYRVEQ
ncbi:MAG: glycosyltransferase [Longimicrobiaceae bacterium]